MNSLRIVIGEKEKKRKKKKRAEYFLSEKEVLDAPAVIFDIFPPRRLSNGGTMLVHK